MQIDEFSHLMAQHPEVDVLCNEIGKKCGKHFLLSNLYASARGLILSALYSQLQKKQPYTLLITLDNADDAQYMYADLRTLIGEQDVYFLPSSHRKRQRTDEALIVQRTEVLSALLNAMHSLEDASLQDGSKTAYSLKARPIIVTYPEALADSVPNPNALEANKISLHVGEEIAISTLTDMLLDLHFQRVDFVYEPGQFAVRGGIVDVYSYADMCIF